MQLNQSFFTSSQAFYTYYLENGFAIEPDIFSDEACNHIVANAKMLPSYQSGNVRPAMQLHKSSDFFLGYLQHSKILTIMQQLVGGEVAGLQTEFFYCKPGTPGFSAHQDNFFVQAPQDAFASAWIALTDVTPEKAGLIVWGESHKAGALPVRDNSTIEHPDQDPNANKTACIIPEIYSPLSLSVKKGSVVFIHGHAVHASHENQTNDWRYVLLCTYIRKGSPFRPGHYAKRAAIDLVQPPFHSITNIKTLEAYNAKI